MTDTMAERIAAITARAAPADYDTESQFEGLNLFVAKGVFDPARARSTRRMFAALNNAPPKKGDSVLEIGVGCGALSILAQRFSQTEPVAVDVMPEALTCAAINFKRFGLNPTLQLSDMFNAVKDQTFDYIMFNAPTAHPSITADNKGVTTLWDAKGDLKSRFIHGLADRLNPHNPQATAIMMYAIYQDYDALTPINMHAAGLDAQRILVEKDDVSETGILLMRRTPSLQV